MVSFVFVTGGRPLSDLHPASHLQRLASRSAACLSGCLHPMSAPHSSVPPSVPQGVLRRVVLLTNTSIYPVLYEWDLGVMGLRDTLSGGVLEVVPASGGRDCQRS